jgi:hypothetical protein
MAHPAEKSPQQAGGRVGGQGDVLPRLRLGAPLRVTRRGTRQNSPHPVDALKRILQDRAVTFLASHARLTRRFWIRGLRPGVPRCRTGTWWRPETRCWCRMDTHAWEPVPAAA